MKFRTTAILASFLAALAAYFYLYEFRSASKEKEAKKIFDFDPHKVETVTFLKGREKITCQREENDWMIVMPLKTKADSQLMQEIVSSLAEARLTEVIEESPSDLAPFGLKRVKVLRITFTLKDEEKTQSLLLGDELPLNKFYVYAKKGDEGRVFSIYAGLRSKLDKSLFDLRDKTLFPLIPEMVKTLEIRRKGEAIICEKKSGKDWWINHPIKTRADREKIEIILNAIKNAEIREFVQDVPHDLSPYGLSRPQIKILLKEEGGERARILEIGGTKGEMVYARRREPHNVFLIKKSILEGLPYEAGHIRDLHPLVFDNKAIEKVELDFPAHQIVLLRRNGEEWEMVEPIQAKADKWKVKGIFCNLEDLIIKDFLSPSEEPSLYGFDRPKIRVTLWEKDIPHTLLVSEKKSSEEYLFAKSSHQDAPFLIDPKGIQNLLKTPFDFRDLHLISFDSRKITKLELKYPDKTILCQKKGTHWRITKPIKAVAEGIKIWDILFALEDLQFSKITAPEEKDLSFYGLKDPRLKITLWDEKGTTIGPLAVGKREAEEAIYLKVSSDESIYEAKPDFLGKIPNDVSLLMYKR